MQKQQQDWLKSFENKTKSELKAMQPPTGLPTVFVEMWRRDRDAAIARLWAREDKAEDTEIAREQTAVEAALSAIENDMPDRASPAETSQPHAPLQIPKGSAADLLEQQIGTCAALIANIADYVSRNDSEPDVCLPFMDRISSMISSSATAARVVGQLRGIASETKQTYVKKVEGEREGGVPQT